MAPRPGSTLHPRPDVCSVDDCERPGNGSRGYCRTHYTRWRRHGDPSARPRYDVAARFEQFVDRSGECHRWMGTHDRNGYGHFSYEGRLRKAHTIALLLVGVTVPPGMTVDHVRARGCRHRDCVRVEHLEVVTHRENSLRGDNPAAINARKTHCKRGHEFTPENTASRPDRSERICRACARERGRRHDAKRRPSQWLMADRGWPPYNGGKA